MTEYFYWENGKMYKRVFNKGEDYFSYEEWNKQGIQEYNGVLKNGKYIGEITLHSNNGEIIEQSIQNEKGYIKTRWFIVDNRLLYVENYKDGALHGEYISYILPYQYLKKGISSFITWDNGVVKIKSKLKEAIYTKGQYVDGKKDGEWIEYNLSNKREVTGIIFWKYGKQVSSTYFDKTEF